MSEASGTVIYKHVANQVDMEKEMIMRTLNLYYAILVVTAVVILVVAFALFRK